MTNLLELRFKTLGAAPKGEISGRQQFQSALTIMPKLLLLLRPAIAIVLAFAVSAAALSARAADTGSPAKSKADKADSGIQPAKSTDADPHHKTGQTVKILGLTIANPTQELSLKHGHSADAVCPIITQVQDSSFFPKGMEPSAGCSIWIIAHPASGSGLNPDTAPNFRPQTAQAVAAAIIACAIPPAEYALLLEAKKKMAREHFMKQKDAPDLQSRLKQIDATTLSAAQATKHSFRLVYNYPGQKGTLTAELHLTKAELDEIRQLAGN